MAIVSRSPRSRPRRTWRWLVAVAAVPLVVGVLGPLTRATAQTTITLFVAQGGSDGNNCRTPALSCATISRALTLAIPGDTIEVSGTIEDHVAFPPNVGPITISGSPAPAGSPAPPDVPAVVDGTRSASVFAFAAGDTAHLDHLTIENGSGQFGGGIDSIGGTVTVADSTITGNSASFDGGGIFNNRTLTITDSTISNNHAGRDGGGMLDAGLTDTTIAASTFSGNTASAFGGGIATGVHSTLSLTNSTMSGNEASLGGGLYTQGTSTITSSTISGNTAGTSGGGIDNTFAAAAVTLGASIVATNTGGNCAGLANTSVGYNLTDDATGEACGFNTSTDVVDSNPSLGPLESNGGPIETMLPAEFSTAVGRIPVPTTLDQVAVCGNGASDQRGVQRPEPPVIACTIGATEVATPVVVAAVGTDGAMWVQAPLLTPGWSSLGGQLIAAPAVAAMPQANGPASPLFIATGTDHALWVRSLSKGWTELAPDVFTFCIDSPGAVVASAAGPELTVACQGGDHHLYAATVPVPLDGSLPSVAAWTNLGGALGAGPAVASVGGQSIYLVTASFNNGQVWARSDSTDWEPTDFFCIGHPALAPSPIGRTTWFACQGTDRQLWAGPLGNVIPRGGAIAPGPGLGLIPGTDFMFAEARFGARSVWYLTPGAPDWLSLGGSVSESSGGVGAVGLIGPLA